MKKRGHVSAKKSALTSALRDLEDELKSLSKERTELKGSIKQTSTTIDADREMQKRLQQKIATLLEKEAKLNQKKKALQTRIDLVADKANKISKIKSEIGDI